MHDQGIPLLVVYLYTLFQSYMKTMSITADVMSLTFNGADQMTDAFWYLLANRKVSLPQVSRISLIGK